EKIDQSCYEKVDDYKPPSTLKERGKKYEGCYVHYKYEHTSWYKVEKFSLPKICIKALDTHLIASSSSFKSDLALFEMEEGLFRVGLIKDNKNLMQYPFDDKWTFKMTSDNSTANHLLINQMPFEKMNDSIGWIALFIVFLLFTGAGCCF